MPCVICFGGNFVWYLLLVLFNKVSVSFSLFIFRSFGCVLHLCRGTLDHDFCAVNKQLYRGDSHPLASTFNTLFLYPFCFDLFFMRCNNRVVSQMMWGLWWTKCHANRIFFQLRVFFPVSIIPLVLLTHYFINC